MVSIIKTNNIIINENSHIKLSDSTIIKDELFLSFKKGNDYSLLKYNIDNFINLIGTNSKIENIISNKHNNSVKLLSSIYNFIIIIPGKSNDILYFLNNTKDIKMLTFEGDNPIKSSNIINPIFSKLMDIIFIDNHTHPIIKELKCKKQNKCLKICSMNVIENSLYIFMQHLCLCNINETKITNTLLIFKININIKQDNLYIKNDIKLISIFDIYNTGLSNNISIDVSKKLIVTGTCFINNNLYLLTKYRTFNKQGGFLFKIKWFDKFNMFGYVIKILSIYNEQLEFNEDSKQLNKIIPYDFNLKPVSISHINNKIMVLFENIDNKIQYIVIEIK
jgi:hypothetical protein